MLVGPMTVYPDKIAWFYWMGAPIYADPATTSTTEDKFVSREMRPLDVVIGTTEQMPRPRHRVKNILMGRTRRRKKRDRKPSGRVSARHG